jgi:hypothetical protein
VAKSAAERKAAQRAREAQRGVNKMEIHLSANEMEILRRNCALRRPGREPYGADEYVELLIFQDNKRLQTEIDELNKRKCPKCGDVLPVSVCCHNGDNQCWITQGCHQLLIKLS